MYWRILIANENRCRFATKPAEQKMDDLAVERITASRPVFKVGIDFTDHIVTKCEHKIISSILKSCICLFIFMTTNPKKIHKFGMLLIFFINPFLAALRRLVCRHSYPSDIYIYIYINRKISNISSLFKVSFS